MRQGRQARNKGRQDGRVRHKEQRGAGTQAMGCGGGGIRGQGRSMHLLAAVRECHLHAASQQLNMPAACHSNLDMSVKQHHSDAQLFAPNPYLLCGFLFLGSILA